MRETTIDTPATKSCSAASPTLFANEPSHIHIPRPSRIRRQSASPEHDQADPRVLQIVLADEAA
jgi:hypothetical protein